MPSSTSPSRFAYVLSWIFGVIMALGAVNHILNPDFYAPMIPSFCPAWFAHGFSVLAEGSIAVLLVLPKTRWVGGLAFAALMVGFMPLHVWDLVRDDPITGSFAGAVVRLIVQLGFIAGGLWLGKVFRPQATDATV